MCPACWAQLSKRHLLLSKNSLLSCLNIFTFSKLPYPFGCIGFNENGYNRRVTEVGVLCLPGGSSMHGTGGGCCVQSRGIMGERNSLNTLQKQTLQSSMAYSDALTMKLLEIQPTRLLLNVKGSAMLKVCPSHGPPPNPNSRPSPGSPPSAYCSSTLPTALLIQNSIFKWRFYPLPFFVCTLK